MSATERGPGEKRSARLPGPHVLPTFKAPDPSGGRLPGYQVTRLPGVLVTLTTVQPSGSSVAGARYQSTDR